MDKNIMYSRDMLYPTENLYEPGSVHIEVLNPDKKGHIPVLVESKTEHSPIKYINSIIRIMQSDIFDRININIRNNTIIYIKADDKLKSEFGDKNYVKVVFQNDTIDFTGIDDIDL